MSETPQNEVEYIIKGTLTLQCEFINGDPNATIKTIIKINPCPEYAVGPRDNILAAAVAVKNVSGDETRIVDCTDGFEIGAKLKRLIPMLHHAAASGVKLELRCDKNKKIRSIVYPAR